MSTQLCGIEDDDGFAQPPTQLLSTNRNDNCSKIDDDDTNDKNSDIPHIVRASTATWRNRGEQLRALVLKQDEANGAHTFVLSSTCPIQRYYQVADKVRLFHLTSPDYIAWLVFVAMFVTGKNIGRFQLN
jgi:hypothetical protein